MSTTVEDDFRDFVVARWGELEPVAHLVILDPGAARRLTTAALAGLHGQWRELLDDGMPGASARRALLTAALATTERLRRATAPPPPRPHTIQAQPADLDPAVAALVGALRSATPLERAVVAASTTWGLDGEGVAHLAGMPAATVREAERSVRRRLRAAHARARAQEGLEPADWAVDRDLAEAVDALVAEVTDPPDAAALVGQERRRVRRRTVVLGAGAALAAGAAGASALDSVATGAASPAPPPVPPGDPAWAGTDSWPPRGALADDRGVLHLVGSTSPRARLVYAGDVAGRRVVVATTADTSGSTGTLVRLWAGPRGDAAERLTAVDLVRDRVTFLDNVVPLALDPGSDGGGGAVLLLARPTVLEAQYSALVRYSSTGDVGRQWTVQPLDDGVGVIERAGPLPPTFRVRLDGYDGAPLGATVLGLPPPDRDTPLAQGLVDALGPFVAACTGLPASAVRSTVAHEAQVRGDVLVPGRAGERVGRGRVVVVLTRLPDGALLRSVRVAGDGRGDIGPVDIETTRVLTAGRADEPVAARLPSFGETVGRFLVLAPGAARAQLVAATTDTYPASEVTPLRGGTGVLEVADARRAPAYRLVTWDASGRRTGAWDQVFRRRDPRDLWPRVR